MSWLSMIILSIVLSPQVFLRYLPTLIFYMAINIGIFFTTDNPWVIGIVLVIMGTMGTTFLFLTGIRAALMTVKATTAPDIEKLLTVTARMMVSLMLVQLLFVLVLGAGVSYLFYVQILPSMIPEMSLLLERPESRELILAGNLPRDLGDQMRMPLALYSAAMAAVVAACFGIFGVPMAAMAANPVKHSPQNDLIFGIGRYFFPQFILYMLVNLPFYAYFLIAPHEVLFAVDPGMSGLGVVQIVGLIVSVYLPCISYTAMALGYRAIRGRVAADRAAERVPIIDYDAERQNVRSLRQARTSDRAGTRMYDPNAPRE